MELIKVGVILYRLVRDKFFDNIWVDFFVGKEGVSYINISGKRVLVEGILNVKVLK